MNRRTPGKGERDVGSGTRFTALWRRHGHGRGAGNKEKIIRAPRLFPVSYWSSLNHSSRPVTTAIIKRELVTRDRPYSLLFFLLILSSPRLCSGLERKTAQPITFSLLGFSPVQKLF